MTSAMNDLSMKNEVHNTNKKEKKGKSTVYEMVKKNIQCGCRGQEASVGVNGHTRSDDNPTLWTR